MGIVNMQPLHLSDTTIRVMPRSGLKDRGIFEGTYDPISSAWSTRRRDRWGPDGDVYHARHRHLPADGFFYTAVRYRGTAHRTANVVDLHDEWRLLLCSWPGTPGAAGPPVVVGILGHDLWLDRTWAASDRGSGYHQWVGLWLAGHAGHDLHRDAHRGCS